MAVLTLDKDGTSQDNELYLSVDTDIELCRALYLTLLFCLYEFDDPAQEDYRHFRAALKKEKFKFALDKDDLDKIRASVTWKREVDL